MGLIAGKSIKKSACCLLNQRKKRGDSSVLFVSPLHLICLLSLLKTIESNWRCGRHSLQRIHCRSETSKGVYCLQYDDQKIVSGLRDNTIKVRMLHHGILMAWSAYAINNSVLISVTPTQSLVSNLAFSFPFPHLPPAQQLLFYLARETLFSDRQASPAEFLSSSNYRLCNYWALYPCEKVKPIFVVKPVISKMSMYCTKEPVEDSADATKGVLSALWKMCCSKKQSSQASKCWKMKTLLNCPVLNVCCLRSGIRIHWNASEFSPATRVLSCASSMMNGWSLLDLQTQQSGVCPWFAPFCLPLKISALQAAEMISS